MSAARWQDRAACRGMDPDLFFPERGDNFGVEDAKAVCARCPVRAECLAWCYQIGAREGIWGGLSERQRRDPETRAGRRKDPVFTLPGREPTWERTEYQRAYRAAQRADPTATSSYAREWRRRHGIDA